MEQQERAEFMNKVLEEKRRVEAITASFFKKNKRETDERIVRIAVQLLRAKDKKRLEFDLGSIIRENFGDETYFRSVLNDFLENEMNGEFVIHKIKRYRGSYTFRRTKHKVIVKRVKSPK